MSDNTRRNEEIVRLRNQGMFPTDIAKKLGVTRNAVIGVCWRAGIVKYDAGASLIAHPPAINARQGEKHPNAKLSNDAIRKIRRLSAIMTQADLARRFKVTEPTISNILAKKTWAHVV